MEQQQQMPVNFIEGLIDKYAYLRQKKSMLKDELFYNKPSGKTITFLTANLGTSEGLYKNLIPAMTINQYSPNTRAFVGNVINFKAGNLVSDYNYNINSEMIEASDWLVLPFMTEDISEFVKLAKSLNPKIKIAYQIDNYFVPSMQTIPDTHPIKQVVKKKVSKDVIISNINRVDMLLFSNDFFTDTFDANLITTKSKIALKSMYLLQSKGIHEKQLMYFAGQSSQSYIAQKEDTYSQVFPKPENALRFMLPISPENIHLLDDFLPIAIKIHEKFKDRIQFVVVGATDGDSEMIPIESVRRDISGEKTNFVSDFIEKNIKPKAPFIRFYNRVDFSLYHSLPMFLNIDAAIIFAKENKFNTHNLNYSKVWEMFALQIPVLASDIPLYRKFIEGGDTGILIPNVASEWVMQIENLLDQLDKKDDLQVYRLFSMAEKAKIKIDAQDASKYYTYYENLFF